MQVRFCPRQTSTLLSKGPNGRRMVHLGARYCNAPNTELQLEIASIPPYKLAELFVHHIRSNSTFAVSPSLQTFVSSVAPSNYLAQNNITIQAIEE